MKTILHGRIHTILQFALNFNIGMNFSEEYSHGATFVTIILYFLEPEFKNSPRMVVQSEIEYAMFFKNSESSLNN